MRVYRVRAEIYSLTDDAFTFASALRTSRTATAVLAKSFVTKIAGWARRFRATSIGEFIVALVLLIAIGSLFLGLVLSAAPTPVHAVDAEWLGGSELNNWNSDTNWVDDVAPVASGDTATFNTSTNTTPTLSDDVTIESITFNPGASAFTISTDEQILTLQGAGIVNNSGNVQTIINEEIEGIGQTIFTNAATAGNSVIINNLGDGTFTAFLGNSNAGSAAINNIGGLSFTGFLNNSNGANATITNSGDNSFTAFFGAASGGNAALINANPTAFITIAELATPGTTAGSIAGNGAIFLGSKNLTVGGNQQSSVFSGVISDGQSPNFPFAPTQPSYTGGSLTKVGAGTLTLSGANTYTGGTTILGGAILTQNASALGTGPVAFGNGAALQVQNLLNANGNWTVSPGTASVSGGTVQTFGDFNLGGGGTLIVNANFNVPGSANINSSGFVVNSSFTANDNINLNGSAAAVVNGLLTSPNVNVNNSSSLMVNAPGTVAANVNVGPSALLGLFGRINGSVVNAGFFQGTGVVNGNVFNSGIVSPGASIGTLTINGDYTQNASGTLRIEVAGASAGQYDVLAVNGRAFINGTLQLVRVGNFRLQVGDRIAFLTATGGVNGTFSNVENDFLATDSIVVLDVVYLANSAVLAGTQVVVLEGTQGSFAEFASLFCGTPNAIAVGEALDSAVGDPRASELIDFLNNEALTDLCEDIDLISPESLTSIFVVGVSLANVQTANLERRMTDIRAGSSGFSGGFAINGSAPSFWEGFAGVSGPEGKSGPAVFAPVPQNRWGVFATGLGEFTNVDSTFNASGYDLATGGFTMGVDYRIGSNFAVGLTGGYAYTSADLVNESSLGVNGGKLGVYATAFSSGFYLDTAVLGGLSGYDTRRTALEGTARGETLGGELNVLVAGGYDWKKGGLSIGPTASFQYTLIGFDGFSESGSLAPLAYPSQNAESFRTAFGARASYDWKIGPAHIIPELRLAWQHEFGETDYSLVSSFASGAGNSFTVSGPEIGRDSMLIGAGFAIHWNDRISTYAYYDGELFRTNFLSNNISAGFRLTF